MKQWLAILAAVAFLTLPAMLNASDDTSIPPEANWSPIPSTPEVVTVAQPRLASSLPTQLADMGAVSPSSPSFSFTAEDAYYKAVNATTKE
jgi:hypothetical protein